MRNARCENAVEGGLLDRLPGLPIQNCTCVRHMSYVPLGWQWCFRAQHSSRKGWPRPKESRWVPLLFCTWSKVLLKKPLVTRNQVCIRKFDSWQGSLDGQLLQFHDALASWSWENSRRWSQMLAFEHCAPPTTLHLGRSSENSSFCPIIHLPSVLSPLLLCFHPSTHLLKKKKEEKRVENRKDMSMRR